MTDRLRRRALASAVLLGAWIGAGGLTACATPADPDGAADTVRIVDLATGQALDAATLRARLRAARTVLLGEQHDNPAHHRARGLLVADLAAAGPLQVVFEQLDRDRQPGVDAWAAARATRGIAGAANTRGERAADLAALLDAGGFDRRGWAWPLHEPVFAAALAPGVRITAGNLSREAARDVVRQGPAAVPPALVGVLGAARWDPAAEAALDEDLADGHCGKLPATMRPKMALAQRVRDAALSDALAAPAGGHAVLIAGNGHVRRDFGVPRYLPEAAGPVVVVGLVERGAVPDDPAALRDALRGLYDIAWVTSPARREDPCKDFAMPRR